MSDFERTLPEAITEIVSFFRGERKTISEYDESSMQFKQAEGAAYLFNLLHEKGIALLADEVGMGKTIQSLAICAALWRRNPNAKILILAPRNEVATNWIKEYETFINVHYLQKDDIVKTRYGEQPVNPAVFCSNLYDLARQVKQKWSRLFIGKISSFSALLSQEKTNARLEGLGIEPKENYDKIHDKLGAVQSIAAQLKESISSHLGNGCFDLLIIDEAHYFRNIEGGSLRVASARAFFGEKDDPIAQKVLLLTATPNHRSSRDIEAIVSYFNQDLSNIGFEKILDEICVRRFRRLAGFTKYQYREEVPVESDFSDKMSELFFGIYQKQLAKSYIRERAGGGTRNMLGFLEGTEFIPQTAAIENGTSEGKGDSKDGSDYDSGADNQLLISLGEKYKEIFGNHPAHPKYDRLIKDLLPEATVDGQLNEKKLVFVRRIPSVREIASRVIEEYDQKLLRIINDALGERLELKKLDKRNYFNRITDRMLSESQEVDYQEFEEVEERAGQEEEQKNLGIPSSRVLDLFKKLKKAKGVVPSTHATNFRLRFLRSKGNVFSVFFSPGSDYFGSPYQLDKIWKTREASKGYQDNYFVTCLKNRLEGINNRAVKEELFQVLAGSKQDAIEGEGYDRALKTLFTIYFEILEGTTRVGMEQKEKIKKIYTKDLNYFQKEALSSFVEKGVLYASSALVDLYAFFIEIQRKEELKSIELYERFTDKVKERFEETSLFDLITESILHFDVLCEKIFGLIRNKELLNYSWSNFFNSLPAYPYSGDTKNPRVLQSFNTPFFPDILISTSVLQEGVNLQYFCEQIIHYGIAWTPGDNEQRVGRIDRMFSKVERRLHEEKGNARLSIQYPYLRNTIDQDHLANFIFKKYVEEDLIDKCRSFAGQSMLDPENFSPENWTTYLRRPVAKGDQIEIIDPFPVKADKWGRTRFIPASISPKPDLKSQIINTFREAGLRTYASDADFICVVDPELESGRYQPVFVRLDFDPIVSGLIKEPTYVLKLVTPLASVDKFTVLKNSFNKIESLYQKSLSVKLCYNDQESRSSSFGIYMRTDLPVFVDHPERPMSVKELEDSFQKIIVIADQIEREIFQSDLSLKDLQDTQIESKVEDHAQLPSRRSGNLFPNNWLPFGDHYYLRKDQRKGLPWSLQDACGWNHKSSFVKFLTKGSTKRMIVSHLQVDVQEVEVQALQACFDFYSQGMHWK